MKTIGLIIKNLFPRIREPKINISIFARTACFVTSLLFSISVLSANEAKSTHSPTPPNFDLPIQHWKTPQGTPVYFIETHVLPMVDIKIAFNAGSAYDGNQSGLANLTNHLLDQGTQIANADQIAEQLDQAGANLTAETKRDMAVVGIRSVTFPKQLALSLSTLKDIIAHPAFPTDAFTRAKMHMEQLLRYQEQNPDLIGVKHFYSALYKQHPYALWVQGELAKLATIKREDVQKFYQQHYTANNAIIAMVGNLTLEEAKKISAELTASLNKGKHPPKLPDVKKNGAITQHISFPSNQTHILMGQIALDKSNPDIFPLLVANHILGGGMHSRLFIQVREDRGLAYNVGSAFLPLKMDGPFLVKLQTNGTQTKETVSLVKKILNEYITKGPTKEELASAKQYLLNNFALKLSTNSAILNSLVEIGFYGLPLNYLTSYQNKIQSVTLDQIQKTLKKYLSPEHFALITVGKDA